MATEHFEDSGNPVELEEQTPLRRQNRAPARTARSGRLWRWTRKAAFPLLMLAAVSWGLWFAARFLLQDPRFRVAAVHLRGAEFAAATEVEEEFASDRGKSLLRVPLRERQRRVEQIAWVRSATVARVFPDQLWVTVQERTPVAFLWTPQGLSLIDEEGVVLDSPPESSFTFPVVRGISFEESAAERRSKMQLFAALMRDLERGSPQLGKEISEVDLSDPEDARVIVAEPSGAILLHLGKEDFLARYLTYVDHIAEWRRHFPSIHSVDLRYQDQVVVNADPQQNRQDTGSRSLPSKPSLPVPPERSVGQNPPDRTPPRR